MDLCPVSPNVEGLSNLAEKTHRLLNQLDHLQIVVVNTTSESASYVCLYKHLLCRRNPRDLPTEDSLTTFQECGVLSKSSVCLVCFITIWTILEIGTCYYVIVFFFKYLVSNPSVVCGIKWTNTQSQTIHTKFHVHPNVLESPPFAGSIIHDFWWKRSLQCHPGNYMAWTTYLFAQKGGSICHHQRTSI